MRNKICNSSNMIFPPNIVQKYVKTLWHILPLIKRTPLIRVGNDLRLFYIIYIQYQYYEFCDYSETKNRSQPLVWTCTNVGHEAYLWLLLISFLEQNRSEPLVWTCTNVGHEAYLWLLLISFLDYLTNFETPACYSELYMRTFEWIIHRYDREENIARIYSLNLSTRCFVYYF